MKPSNKPAPEQGRGPTSEGDGESSAAVNPANPEASGQVTDQTSANATPPATTPGPDPLAGIPPVKPAYEGGKGYAAPDPLGGLVRGRVVYYTPLPYEAQGVDPGPWAAIVTDVSAVIAGQVTLNIQLPKPSPIGSDPVQRRAEVPFSETPAPGCWSWMFSGQGSRYHVVVDPPAKEGA